MPRKLRVYGWRGYRLAVQTREVMAATSKKKVREIAGIFHTGPLSEICETGSEEEVAQAMTEPGVVFWHQIDEILKKRKWRRV